MKTLLLMMMTALALLSGSAVAQRGNELPATAEAEAQRTASFVEKAVTSDMFEIEAGKLAQSKGARTKDFGARLVADHTKTSSELKTLVDSGSIKAQLPTALDQAHKTTLIQLQKLRGVSFDGQFIADSILGHKQDIALFEQYTDNGENSELKAFAAKYLPVLQEHLKMAEQLQKSAPK